MEYHNTNKVKINITNRKTLILVTLFAFFSSACTDAYNDAASNNTQINKISLTPEEYASIAYDEPKELSENEIIDVINNFQCLESQIRNKAMTKSLDNPKVSNIKKHYLSYSNGITKHNITRSANFSKFDIRVHFKKSEFLTFRLIIKLSQMFFDIMLFELYFVHLSIQKRYFYVQEKP